MRSLAARELAVVAGIDTAIASETQPEYALLFLEAKDGHQAAYAQLSALARLDHGPAARSAPFASIAMKLEARLAQMLGTRLTLQAMRAIEHQLIEAYTTARDEASHSRRAAFSELAARASQRWHLLTAHVAHARHDDRAAEQLPLPITAYFARETPRVCMRCLVDRPGTRPSLVREQPHQYVCAACHDEVSALFPADLRIHTWPTHLRYSRVIEKALGRPAKQLARDRVHTVLAGQPPLVAAPLARFELPPAAPRPDDVRATQLAGVTEGASERERAYCEELFDARALRRRW